MNMKYVKSSITLVGLAFMMACHSGDKKNTDAAANAINPNVVNNPATASQENKLVKDEVPVIQFDTETHDFGTIAQGEIISYSYQFENTGKVDLVIRSASGSCGCTVPEYSKEAIAPGKNGIINVTFNSEGKEGMQNKTITVVANTIPNSKVLTITGEVVKK